MVEKSNLILEQKIELGKLNFYIQKWEGESNYNNPDLFRDVEPLYKKGILPEKIISKKVQDFLSRQNEMYPFACKEIHNAFSKQLKKYEETKKKS